MDKQGQRAKLQESICATCNTKVEVDCRPHISKLQSSSSTVSWQLSWLNFQFLITFISRELSSTFARLCRVVDMAQSDMNTELKEIETSLNILEGDQKQIKLLRNKASYITNKLDTFENNYIKSN